ncbi:hypothetical protein B0H66DRAFT_587854 [Apodospora peruviana]|uniref:Rhamnogalacturonase A/B/Epimerase-like pectate lyase domain-containing protein n=1 Tax=Apodospora peruviana TaxID=516989 RepID=A0AAE0IH60_9PEZI|nr:hypothetical protein B0H66DRAFT_587854 [Apodospora peruviana]
MKEGNTQIGLFIENGSGGFIGDLSFEGGQSGMRCGNQQFTSRDLIPKLQKRHHHAVGLGLRDVVINSTTGDFAGGSITVLDSKFSNVKTGILVSQVPQKSKHQANVSLLNVQYESVGTMVSSSFSNATMSGGTGSVDSWFIGNTYTDGEAQRGSWSNGKSGGATKIPADLLYSGPASGGYFARSKQQYSGSTGWIAPTAKGDGVTDDTAALHLAFTLASEQGKAVFLPIGSYIVTDTLDTAVVGYLGARKMFDHDPREPPLAPQSTPMIGHMIGMQANHLPDFHHVSTEAEDSYHTMRVALKPGPELDDMNRVMIQEIVRALNRAGTRIPSRPPPPRSAYGPMNPYNDKTVADAFWEFEAGLMTVLIGFLSSLTARKPIAARDKLAETFEAYYKAGGLEQASVLAKKQYQAEVDNKVPLQDIARFEVGGSVAILVNTSPAAFWTLFFLYVRPGLLADVRVGFDACVERTGDNINTINISNLKERCPLLLSSYKDTLRHRSMGTSVREVIEDTLLDGRWLPKKGTMLQMPLDNGSWEPPTTANTYVAAIVVKPDHDVHVSITKRPAPGGDGGDKVKTTWAVSLNGSEKSFAMVTEDVAVAAENETE